MGWVLKCRAAHPYQNDPQVTTEIRCSVDLLCAGLHFFHRLASIAGYVRSRYIVFPSNLHVNTSHVCLILVPVKTMAMPCCLRIHVAGGGL